MIIYGDAGEEVDEVVDHEFIPYKGRFLTNWCSFPLHDGPCGYLERHHYAKNR